MNLTGALTNAAGTLNLDSASGSWNMNGGSITGGTLRLRDGATLVPNGSSGNRLVSIALDGELAVAPAGARLRITSGLSAGTVRVTGGDAALVFDNTQALADTLIAFEGTTGTNARLGVEGSSSLTIGAGAIVRGGHATIGGGVFNTGSSTILNQGLISADIAGQTLTIQGSALQNQGLLRAIGGGSLIASTLAGNAGNISVDGAGTSMILDGSYAINSPVSVTGGSTLRLNGAWSNPGGINLTDSTLLLGGSFSTAQLGTINRTNSVLGVAGSWNNTGGTITIDPTTGPVRLAGGIITGGVINTSGGVALQAQAGTSSTLTDVTLNGALSLPGATVTTTNLALTGTADLSSGAVLNLNGSWSNNGVINVNSSTLNLGGTVSFAGLGTINRTADSAVNLSGILNASGQTITISPTSLLTGINGGTLRVGTLELQNNPTLTMNGGLLYPSALIGSGTLVVGNQARIQLDPSFGPGTITIDPGVTIRGGLAFLESYNFNTGETILNRGTIRAEVSGQTMYVGPGGGLTNEGTLAAVSGALLQIGQNIYNNNPRTPWSSTGLIDAAGGTVLLGGTMSTSGLGTIHQSSGGQAALVGDLDNAGASLNLGPDLNISYFGGRVQGGTINIPLGMNPYFAGWLAGVQINGDFTSGGGWFTGGLGLSGTAHIQGRLNADGSQTVSGGTALLEGGTLGTVGGDTLTLAPGTVVRGRGFLGTKDSSSFNPQNYLVNNGLISADVPGQSLNISSQNFLNNGTLEAINGASVGFFTNFGPVNWTNAGILRVAGGATFDLGGGVTWANGTLVNDGGVFNITGTLNNAGSTFAINSASGSINLRSIGRINGGTVTTADGARLVATAGNPVLAGVIVNGDIDVISAPLGIDTSLTLGGSIRASGAGASVGFTTPTGLLSGGTLSLAGPSAASLHRLTTIAGGTATLGPGTVVRGGNAALADDTNIGGNAFRNTLINQGRISADVAGQTLSILPDNFTNSGTVEAVAGGTLNIGGTGAGSPTDPAARTWSSTGTIRVDNAALQLGGFFSTPSLAGLQRTGGTVQILGALDNSGSAITLDGTGESWLMGSGFVSFGQFVGSRIMGGTVNLLNGANIDAGVGGGGGTFQGVTLNGDLTCNGGLLMLDNTTVNGTVTIAGANAGLRVGAAAPGPATLSTGTYVLQGTVAPARFVGITGDDLTIGPGVTIRGGQGTITRSGSGTSTLLNQGLISADVAGQQIRVDTIGTFTNSGTLEAINGGTLAIGGEIVNTGAIRATGGTVELFGRYSSDLVESIQRSSATINLGGYLENTDRVLDMDGATAWRFINRFTLKGGTVNLPAGTSVGIGGGIAALDGITFDNVAFNGDLHTLPTQTRVDILHNLALNGTFSLAAPSSTLTFAGDQTFATGTIFFDPATGTGERVLATRGLGPGGQGDTVLTIGQDATVRGGNGRIRTGAIAGGNEGTVINQGLVSADLSGQTITIESRRFVNQGTTQAINGGILTFEGPPPISPIDWPVLDNAGRLNVGPGSTLATGILVHEPGASIALRLAGAESWGDYGRLAAEIMQLSGDLTVELVAPYEPMFGDSFDLMDFAVLEGEFVSLRLPELGGDLVWNTGALYTTGIVTVVPEPATLALLGLGIGLISRRRRS